MKPNKKSVAKRLKLLKDKLGLSISEFAEKVGTSKANLSSYMRGLALPPEEIVNNISKLCNVPKEWIYIGDLSEQIEDYIIMLGHERFLEDYPESVDIVRAQLERLRSDKKINIDGTVIGIIYDDFYRREFRKYVKELLMSGNFKVEIDRFDKVPSNNFIYSDWDSFFEKVMEEIYKDEEKIVYKDEEKILSVVRKVLRRQIYLFERNKTLPSMFEKIVSVDDYLEYLIRELKSVEGTKEMILSICKNQTKDIEVNEERFERTIEVFRNMVKDLESIQIKYKKHEL